MHISVQPWQSALHAALHRCEWCVVAFIETEVCESYPDLWISLRPQSDMLPESHMLFEAPQVHDAPFIDFCCLMPAAALRQDVTQLLCGAPSDHLDQTCPLRHTSLSAQPNHKPPRACGAKLSGSIGPDAAQVVHAMLLLMAPPRLVLAADPPPMITASKAMATNKAVPRMLMPLRVLLLRQLQPTAHPRQSRTQRGMLLLLAPMTLLTVAPMMLVQMASLTPVQMASLMPVQMA